MEETIKSIIEPYHNNNFYNVFMGVSRSISLDDYLKSINDLISNQITNIDLTIRFVINIKPILGSIDYDPQDSSDISYTFARGGINKIETSILWTRFPSLLEAYIANNWDSFATAYGYSRSDSENLSRWVRWVKLTGRAPSEENMIRPSESIIQGLSNKANEIYNTEFSDSRLSIKNKSIVLEQVFIRYFKNKFLKYEESSSSFGTLTLKPEEIPEENSSWSIFFNTKEDIVSIAKEIQNSFNDSINNQLSRVGSSIGIFVNSLRRATPLRINEQITLNLSSIGSNILSIPVRFPESSKLIKFTTQEINLKKQKRELLVDYQKLVNDLGLLLTLSDISNKRKAKELLTDYFDETKAYTDSLIITAEEDTNVEIDNPSVILKYLSFDIGSLFNFDQLDRFFPSDSDINKLKNNIEELKVQAKAQEENLSSSPSPGDSSNIETIITKYHSENKDKFLKGSITPTKYLSDLKELLSEDLLKNITGTITISLN